MTESKNLLTGFAETDISIPLLIIIIAMVAALAVVAVVFIVLKKKDKAGAEDPITRAPLIQANRAVQSMELSENAPVLGFSMHGIGQRNSQQDSYGYAEKRMKGGAGSRVLAVVADGMGGLSDGERISSEVVESFINDYNVSDPTCDPWELLYQLVQNAAGVVNNDLGPEGIGKCGSTVAAVCVSGGLLYFVSVGDSHIYLWRDQVLYQLNKDHNYAAVLDEQVKKGEISQNEALTDPNRAALTSYIGMGELTEIDQGEGPVELMRGDRILLMSDGVFGTIPTNEINGILSTQSSGESCGAMEYAIRIADRMHQDNYTCLLLEVK